MIRPPMLLGHRSLSRWLLIASLLALASVPAARPPVVRAAASGVFSISDGQGALLFSGYGYGHGVGMCQWGARGRALAGQSAETILAAYYPNTAVAPDVPIESTVRVRIHRALPAGPGQVARVYARQGAWRIEGQEGSFPPDSYLHVTGGQAGQPPALAVHAPDGRGLVGGLGMPITLHPGDPGARFQLAYAGRPSGTTYRGSVSLVPQGGAVLTINTVGIDDYLRGVIGAEMPPKWPTEALRTQIIASRSYAYAQTQTNGHRPYHFDGSFRSQVYRGTAAEQAHINTLIDESQRLGIVFQGEVISALFSSTCSGWTENNEDVWDGPARPYLRAIRDLDAAGQPYDVESPYAWWDVGPMSVAQLEAALNAGEATRVGTLQALDLSRRTQSGRLTHIQLVGSSGERTVRADTFLSAIANWGPDGARPLWSANFRLFWTDAAPVNGGAVDGGVARQASAPPPPPSEPVWHLERTNPVPEDPAIGGRFFPQTGHHVLGVFLDFFDRYGGVDLFGYPRTEASIEDGRMVQYFQRARFELHPEKAGTPYEVQLTLIGSILTAEQAPFPADTPFESGPDHRYFAETGYGVHFAFRRFYEERDGLTILGYPISGELKERGMTVQYFQRGRLEYHPELPQAYWVTLGLLGDEWLQAKRWLK